MPLPLAKAASHEHSGQTKPKQRKTCWLRHRCRALQRRCGGFSVPLPALRLLWDLEERGFHLGQAEDGALLVSPRSRLTADDDAAIRNHKDELKALVGFCEVM